MASGAHNDAYSRARSSLEAYGAEQAPSWQVYGGVDFVGRHPNGPRWVVCPDLMVYTRGGNARRTGYLWYAEDGPPELIMEVLEYRSWRYETDVVSGKGMRYLAMGVQEYLLFDPYAEFLGVHCQGWRSWQGQPRPWLPDARGRYWSRTLGLCFVPLPHPYRGHWASSTPAPLVPGVLDQEGTWIGVPRDRWPSSRRR